MTDSIAHDVTAARDAAHADLTPAQWERLPKWAREHMTLLATRRREAEARAERAHLSVGPEDRHMVLDPLGDKLALPGRTSRTTVRALLDGGRAVDVTVRETADGRRRVLEVTAARGDMLSVLPFTGNRIELQVRDA